MVRAALFEVSKLSMVKRFTLLVISYFALRIPQSEILNLKSAMLYLLPADL